MDHAEGDRSINESERGGCGERMATIPEEEQYKQQENGVQLIL